MENAWTSQIHFIVVATRDLMGRFVTKVKRKLGKKKKITRKREDNKQKKKKITRKRKKKITSERKRNRTF